MIPPDAPKEAAAMKHPVYLIVILILSLVLSACAGQRLPSDAPGSEAPNSDTLPAMSVLPGEQPETAFSEAPVTAFSQQESTSATAEPDPKPGALTENTAFADLAGPCDGSVLALLYNAPFADGEPAPSIVWNEGEYDQLVVYPRYVGSTVSVYRVSYDAEGKPELENTPAYTAVCAQGDSIGAALDRPEGGPCWIVSVQAPNGAEAACELAYNGRYGTPAYEYLTDPSASSLYRQLPEPEELGDLEGVLGRDVLWSFLRAAARAGIDPWQAMTSYCAPYADMGDSAAYTLSACEMEGDTCRLEAVLLRENYDPGEGSLAERAAAQAALYEQIGNAGGILKPDAAEGEALYADLKGITVYNPTLLARTVSVTVNGTDAGTFQLTEGDFCTLLELDFAKLPADRPAEILVRVTEARGGDPSRAVLELWTALSGNISGAR